MWRHALLLTGLLLLMVARGPCPPLRAEEETRPSPEPEEPELKGEAKRKHDKEVKQLLQALHREKNRTIVKGKIEELGAQGTRVARDTLMKFVVGNKNQEYVHHSFMALAKIGNKKAIAFLCGKHALTSRDFLVQHSAAEALAEAKDVRATKPLLEVMTSRRTKIKVVSACAGALAKTAPHDEHVVEVLFEYSRHRKDTIRAYVISALGYLATDAAIARIADALENDENTRVREYAATGLGNSKRADTLPLLRKALAEQTAHTVRTACMEAIRVLQGG